MKIILNDCNAMLRRGSTYYLMIVLTIIMGLCVDLRGAEPPEEPQFPAIGIFENIIIGEFSRDGNNSDVVEYLEDSKQAALAAYDARDWQAYYKYIAAIEIVLFDAGYNYQLKNSEVSTEFARHNEFDKLRIGYGLPETEVMSAFDVKSSYNISVVDNQVRGVYGNHHEMRAGYNDLSGAFALHTVMSQVLPILTIFVVGYYAYLLVQRDLKSRVLHTILMSQSRRTYFSAKIVSVFIMSLWTLVLPLILITCFFGIQYGFKLWSPVLANLQGFFSFARHVPVRGDLIVWFQQNVYHSMSMSMYSVGTAEYISNALTVIPLWESILWTLPLFILNTVFYSIMAVTLIYSVTTTHRNRLCGLILLGSQIVLLRLNIVTMLSPIRHVNAQQIVEGVNNFSPLTAIFVLLVWSGIWYWFGKRVFIKSDLV
ncbi:hypothetical protein G7062_10890 [Erysipelothrix sp. HDW6C]|uniref:hypothetical protein n=1 Tax=Erysipelothrix sp. HDW6C TaxID=2714930 RepID=UPI0014098391|nr:hypothetical protein [Erysipelothrix sp. HDW6C]QIK70769.1 hypothetical protein G7062_10890 [Erysipelothrix sp. HDW6C]